MKVIKILYNNLPRKIYIDLKSKNFEKYLKEI